jgi:hypothetical protein
MNIWLKEKIFRAIGNVIWMIFVISMGVRTIFKGKKDSAANFQDDMNIRF